jgi:hypothetical protein
MIFKLEKCIILNTYVRMSEEQTLVKFIQIYETRDNPIGKQQTEKNSLIKPQICVYNKFSSIISRLKKLNFKTQN